MPKIITTCNIEVVYVKWPKTLGDRDRAKQYDSFVKPVSAEDKIILTQTAHMKAQKELTKACLNVEKAINHYFKARYGAKEVINKLDVLRLDIREKQEEIKKMTLNALPYKDLNEERMNEELFSNPIKRISKKLWVYIIAIIINIIIYIIAFAFQQSWFYALGFLISAIIFLSYYIPWSRNTEKTLATSKKVGPKVW